MTFPRSRTKQREALYASECHKALASGRGEHPICKLCDLPITPGSLWDINHEAHKPKWLGGVVDGISHRRCNRIHNHTIDTPLYAKSERQRKRHLDLPRSANPVPGGREDRLKKCMNGDVVERT